MTSRSGVFAVAMATACLAISFASSAGASVQPGASESVNLWVNGRIVGGCAFETADLKIPLGQIKASELPAVGAPGPWVERAFRATACDAVNRVLMSFDGVPDVDDANLFAVDDASRGIAIELQTADGRPVVPRSLQPVVWDPLPARGEFGYRARYKRVRDMTPGNADATVTVGMMFE
ncbi:type 1 fimbria pilin [Luteibacter rhizovicinus]|uniref:Type 1 fimbria pilin n=1 Tax=Luteibacter rhizovicinus TaxID=242606 RepID=A0A4R3YNF1_9GAMM|nr:fimbrial protein [Luteibacter rhizovicinus]TCV93870.1 type 1 fimbria pilin [Luteibacter rhizovicinus]